jgi:hypothetical protein
MIKEIIKILFLFLLGFSNVYAGCNIGDRRCDAEGLLQECSLGGIWMSTVTECESRRQAEQKEELLKDQERDQENQAREQQRLNERALRDQEVRASQVCSPGDEKCGPSGEVLACSINGRFWENTGDKCARR